ncbi:SRPBCC domain-containing protein [Rhizobium sp. TH2]|uniref:SRPBCC family protein n=1 Tax=Rhizobium sp. TH2 TaxID=2775403 RepID=UPI0021573E4F|nr:SRPBCC domain-containing protein [Rhizobium sp. TH2]UVC09562.1 SRPBCC domain-containing protein [Rhizobium sp. TH2]
MSELELTISRTIPASREKVFNAWLSPKVMAQFMNTPMGGNAPAKVSNDPVRGGRFSIVMMNEDKEIPHAGTYLAIDPHSHLSFTWESPYSLDDSVVTIDLAEVDAGMTEITLRQVKFSSEQSRDGHREGWTAIVGHLANILS